MVLSKVYFFFVSQILWFLKASSQTFLNARHFSEQSWTVLYNQDNHFPAPLSPVPLYFSSLSLLRTALHYLKAWNRLTSNLRSGVLAGYSTTSSHPQGKAPWWRGWNSTRRVSPFLALGDFHARSRFARSTIPEEKWRTLRKMAVVQIASTRKYQM